MRSYEPRWGGDSVNFAMLNRGKKSLALDLKNDGDRARLRPLLARADVIVEQFRPGVMARLGLDYATVAKENPRIIYCAITGYGQHGPKRDVAGHDLNYIGDAGLLALSMGQPAHPVVPPALIADIAGGAYPAVMNILFALMQRGQTGRGCEIDISMSDNLFPFMYWALGEGFATGRWPANGAALVCGGTPRYRLYATQDLNVVAAAPIEQRFWEIFCDIIELGADLRDDVKDPAKTTARIEAIIASAPAVIWRERFKGKDCCCSVVSNVEAAAADPHFRARGLFDYTLVNAQGDRLPALPVPVAPEFRADKSALLSAPQLGSSNSEFDA
jgi:crotonobetainyl-CoA:carnitine CoA-transferase CaiB-like acyl-CoA transferase